MSNFLKEYFNHVFTSYKKVIFSINGYKANYEYMPRFHIKEDYVDKMVNLVVQNILFYCYYENELSDEEFFTSINDLDNHIRVAIQERLNRRTFKEEGNENLDGLLGELVLDLLIRMENNDAKTLLCRPLYQPLGDNNQELKNYDAMLFVDNAEQIKLILGQSKSGKYSYCISGIKSDLKTKYASNYFGRSILYLKERSMIEKKSERLDKVLRGLNKVSLTYKDENEKHLKVCEYLIEKNIKVIIPCLIFYDNENIYDNFGNIKADLKIEMDNVKESIDEETFPISNIDYEICFYIFPTISNNKIKKMLLDFKKELFNANW